jgi:hypothetical protein
LSPRTKFNRVVTCIFDVNCGVGEFLICEQEGVLRNLVKKKKKKTIPNIDWQNQ